MASSGKGKWPTKGQAEGLWQQITKDAEDHRHDSHAPVLDVYQRVKIPPHYLKAQ